MVPRIIPLQRFSLLVSVTTYDSWRACVWRTDGRSVRGPTTVGPDGLSPGREFIDLSLINSKVFEFGNHVPNPVHQISGVRVEMVRYLRSTNSPVIDALIELLRRKLLDHRNPRRHQSLIDRGSSGGSHSGPDSPHGGGHHPADVCSLPLPAIMLVRAVAIVHQLSSFGLPERHQPTLRSTDILA